MPHAYNGRSRGLAAGAILAALVGGWLGYGWWTGEERVIRGRLNGLAATLSPADGGELAAVTRIAQLQGYFAPDVTIRAGSQETISREALMALLARWEPPSQGLTIELVDVAIALAPGDASAHVTLTAKLSGRDRRTGEPIVDAREANVTMTKLDGDWVVAAVESAETLQRP